MMHAIRPFVSEQDENAAPSFAAKYAGGGGAAGLGGGTGADWRPQGKGFQGGGGFPSAAKGPRRALGNITNLTPAGKGGGAGGGLAPAAKTFAATETASRRALGDITNKKPSALNPAPVPIKRPEESMRAKPADAEANAERAAGSKAPLELSLDELAELYANDGIEGPAGMMWDEQLRGWERDETGLASWLMDGDSLSPFGPQHWGTEALAKSKHDQPFQFDFDQDEFLDVQSPGELPMLESPVVSTPSFGLDNEDINAVLDALAKVDMSALTTIDWEE